jgi:hypothetical protein
MNFMFGFHLIKFLSLNQIQLSLTKNQNWIWINQIEKKKCTIPSGLTVTHCHSGQTGQAHQARAQAHASQRAGPLTVCGHHAGPQPERSRCQGYQQLADGGKPVKPERNSTRSYSLHAFTLEPTWDGWEEVAHRRGAGDGGNRWHRSGQTVQEDSRRCGSWALLGTHFDPLLVTRSLEGRAHW